MTGSDTHPLVDFKRSMANAIYIASALLALEHIWPGEPTLQVWETRLGDDDLSPLAREIIGKLSEWRNSVDDELVRVELAIIQDGLERYCGRYARRASGDE
ncbi:MAG: hypothetical protein JW850_06715 [Thermoflexales bacterium]|nr:hypothetical protein [Thermoflexales bacterium]